MWIAFDLKRAFELKESIMNIDKQRSIISKVGISSSKLIEVQTQGVLGLRRTLDTVSKLGRKEHEDYSPIEKNSEQSAWKQNLSEIKNRVEHEAKNIAITAQNVLVDQAGESVQNIDKRMQEMVDKIIRPPTKKRIFNFIIYLLTVLGPLYLIYAILPWMGG